MVSSGVVSARGGPSAAQRDDTRPDVNFHIGGTIERCWLVAALLLALLFAARGMAPAFTDGAVQTDALQHVFWTARFQDPELFPNDLIADYFQAVDPPGYKALYWTLARVVDPLQASRLLPLLLGQASAIFTFLLVRQLHPAPVVAFVAAVLLTWYVWQYPDLASGTPHAFMLPLLTAQLWSLVAGRRLLAVGLVVLTALFYPMAAALGVALLGVRLLQLRGWRPALTGERRSWLAFIAAALLVGGLLSASQLSSARFGPIASATEARAMPEFGPRGRQSFFRSDPYEFWVSSELSGVGLELGHRFPLAYLLAAGLLPLLWPFRHRLPAFQSLSSRSLILLQLLIASFGLFFLAHLVLFRLFLPNRYTRLSVPLVLSVATALVFGVLAQEAARRVRWAQFAHIAGGAAVVLGMVLALHPGRYVAGLETDDHPTITAYLRSQPKDVLTAGWPKDMDSIPARAERSVFLSRKHALPYHLGYYEELRRRARDLIEAYYAESQEEVADFAERYGVDLLLVNESVFDRQKAAFIWSSSGLGEPDDSAAARKIARAKEFALLALASRCAVARDGDLALVPVSCLESS